MCFAQLIVIVCAPVHVYIMVDSLGIGTPQ